jgi:hypothetical protein
VHSLWNAFNGYSLINAFCTSFAKLIEIQQTESFFKMEDKIEVLRTRLFRTRPTVPLIVKILRVLNFEKDHPGFTNNLGAFWSGDDGSFISHAQILSQFLGVKGNSINTNFRQHGFTAPKLVTLEQLRQLRPSSQGFRLADERNWKHRKHQIDTFRPTTTLEEAATLGDQSWRAFRTHQVGVLPIEDPQNNEARNQWSRQLGFVDSVPMDIVLPAFISQQENDDPRHITQLRVNFGDLCSFWRDSESLMKGTLSITAFIPFFRCFGSPSGIQQQIEEITDSRAAGMVMKSPRFIDGICIGVQKDSFAERWATAAPETWALIEGEQEGTFRLLTRRCRMDLYEDRSRIVWIDVTNVEKRMGFKKIADGQIMWVANVSALLDSLELQKQAGLGLEDRESVKQCSWPIGGNTGREGLLMLLIRGTQLGDM